MSRLEDMFDGYEIAQVVEIDSEEYNALKSAKSTEDIIRIADSIKGVKAISEPEDTAEIEYVRQMKIKENNKNGKKDRK